MAVQWLASGTATITRPDAALLTGSMTIDEFPAVFIHGTATIDRRSVAAWGAQVRRTATRVLLGEEAEDLVSVAGVVNVNLDEHGLIETASFSVTDTRCAFFDPRSIVVGGIPVSIQCRIGTDLAETVDTVFRGVTESAPSTGAYVPTATIQCAGEGADWLTTTACLSVPAFSGYTRVEILKAFAATVGITPDRIVGGETWRTVHQGFDLSGLSPYELARRFALMEDCYLRLVGGVLHILPAREVVGPAAVPVVEFAQGTIFSAAEAPPNRPVSRLVLSAVAIPTEVLSGTAPEEVTAAIAIERAPDGTIVEEVRTYTTTVGGVLVRRRVETWRNAAIPGVTPSAVAFRLWRLAETETTWGTVTVDGVSLRTSRMDQERTTTREWYSPPCRSSSGYVWAAPDGARHLHASAQWLVTEDRITTYVYDDDCVLTAKSTAGGRWYSAKVASGHLYDDGTQRADVSYQWIPPDADQPGELQTEVSSEERGDGLHVVSTQQRSYGWDGADVEEWRRLTGRDDRWEGVPGTGLVWHAFKIYREDGTTSEGSAPEAGSVPALARASASIPQHKTEPIVLEAVADSTAPLSEAVTETVWGAEDHTDLKNVARRRFRDERSPRYTHSHRANPHLRQYDVAATTDPTWQHAGRSMYLAGYSLALDASTTGGLDEDYVWVVPLPAYDPGVELEAA